MKQEQLERLLNTACEIITELEDYVQDKEIASRIDALFNEIKYSADLDADMEAQDWDVFGDKKI